MTKRILGLGAALVGAMLMAAPAKAQSNYISFNNGSEFVFVLAGMTSSGANPNLYYRCYPQCVLYPATANIGPTAALDATGWQYASSTTAAGAGFGTPLFYFMNDPGLTCSLSAAAGGGFPPTKAKITASANNLASYYFYTSVPCAFPTGWWFSFAGSASFGMPNPTAGGGNLLAGWSDKNGTTSLNFQYVTGSGDESAAARGRSWSNQNAGGLGRINFPSGIEWEMEMMIQEAAIRPEAFIGGAFDSGGSSGYSPKVGTGKKVRYVSMSTSEIGAGNGSLFMGNLLFQTSCTQCHVPGITLFSQKIAANVDTLWILMFSLFNTPTQSGAGAVGPFWNPNAGWTPGGEWTTVASLPAASPGLVGLQHCFASVSYKLPTAPIFKKSSNGSQLRFK
jgi:hypothetical protein